MFICCMLLHIHVQCDHVVLFGYGLPCPKFSETTNCQYLWKCLSDFVGFFACSCLHLARYPLTLQKICYFRLALSSIGSQPIGLSRCFKLKKLKNYMRYQVDVLLPLKLQKICYFGLQPQNTLGQLFCRIFYF